MQYQQNEQPEAKQPSDEQNKFGHNRPAPSFVPASVATKETEVQEGAVVKNVDQQNALQVRAVAS
ncbi:MAG: hypothetical protein L3J21_06035, partial [Devosiaceae bacterium]|nr:hypothetical protein [Devosiaceae bacterium]